MELKIGNKNYTLYFGWDFLEQINNIFGVVTEVDGMEINTRTAGLSFMNAGLNAQDPVAISKIIKAATSTEVTRPSMENIRKAIEEMLVNDVKAYKEFVKELDGEIKKEPLLKAYMAVNR